MLVNGIELDELTESSCSAFPSEVEGRVLQLDGDAACYKVTYNEDESMDTVIQNFWSMTEYRRRMSGSQFVNIHLTGHDKGGRYRTATVKKYQGNRDGKVKPINLIKLREYLERLDVPPIGCYVVLHQNQEADDGMTQDNYNAIQNGTPELSIIMAEDKDLTMASGLHCDWNTFKIVNVQGYGSIHLDDTKSTKKIKGYGTSFFWSQLLTGDAADNIPGCELIGAEILELYDPLAKPNPKRKPKKCGPVLAYNILKDCENDIQAMHRVLECYKSCYSSPHIYTSWDGRVLTREPVEMLYEQAELLWMRRTVGEAPRTFFKEIVDAS